MDEVEEPDEDFDITEAPDLDEFEAQTEEDDVVDEGNASD